MDKKYPISHSSKKESLIAKSQKDLAKKLEMLSGKHIEQSNIRIVYLVIDCSGSMSEGNKMKQAKKGSVGFANEAQKRGYAVGLIKFASDAEHILDPQNELTNLNTHIENMVADGSTNMGAALRVVIDKLVDRTGEKVICIITDGMPDDKITTLQIADEAKLRGIDILTIGTDDADKIFLEKLATRKELSAKVSRDQLEHGIVSMAKMLTGKTE